MPQESCIANIVYLCYTGMDSWQHIFLSYRYKVYGLEYLQHASFRKCYTAKVCNISYKCVNVFLFNLLDSEKAAPHTVNLWGFQLYGFLSVTWSRMYYKYWSSHVLSIILNYLERQCCMSYSMSTVWLLMYFFKGKINTSTDGASIRPLPSMGCYVALQFSQFRNGSATDGASIRFMTQYGFLCGSSVL